MKAIVTGEAASRACEYCEKKYAPKYRHQRFCSNSCSQRGVDRHPGSRPWSDARRNAIMNTERNCRVCPNTYVGHPSKKYCSKTCADIAYKARKEARDGAPLPARVKYEKIHSLAKEAMMKVQDGKCRICETDVTGHKKAHLDHDHATGRYRSVLCSECNTTLGLMKDDPERLRKAARYLEEMK